MDAVVAFLFERSHDLLGFCTSKAIDALREVSRVGCLGKANEVYDPQLLRREILELIDNDGCKVIAVKIGDSIIA